MTQILYTENRICPFCGHKYIRKVYRKGSTASICPTCHKRSDKTSMRPGRYKSPVLTLCKRPECNNHFYKLGGQQYCSKECYWIVERPRRTIRVREWREKKKMEEAK